ncbi:centromere protein K [Eublepharis macularius]|uniref:Centromere protein K n=1 Tax=Eublepharis macularius TaxID=481883 RepID=A0AA97JRL4_EUBMA|nr:centromere protein K [Eublepharis macularius]XP_054842911.1 centromere protein K [Eublepharis macularius]
MSLSQQDLNLEDAKEQLLEECEGIWKQVEECQNKLTFQEIETVPATDPKLSLLLHRMKALTAEFNQWQKRTPEIITTNPDVLVALGKDQLQRLDHDLEMILSTVHAKNKKLNEDLLREQQWLEEQQQLIDCLDQTEKEISNQVVQFSEKRAFQELKSKMLKIKAYKEELLNALGEFVEKHFPLPEDDGIQKKKTRSSREEDVQLITLHEILESLINTLINKPHDPYVTINNSFWSPYIELLLRYGIALRHLEDPSRIRLENFYD